MVLCCGSPRKVTQMVTEIVKVSEITQGECAEKKSG